jgi:hypothetical protein
MHGVMARYRNAEDVFDLAEPDDDGGSRHETRDYAVTKEISQPAQSEDPHCSVDGPRKQCNLIRQPQPQGLVRDHTSNNNDNNNVSHTFSSRNQVCISTTLSEGSHCDQGD